MLNLGGQKAPAGRFSSSKNTILSAQKAPAERISSPKHYFIRQKNPLRDAYLAQNTIQIRLRACRRPSILSPVKPLRHQTLETPFRRFNKVPIPWGGPKGTQGNPRVPKGTEGRLRRPWGGWAHGAPWGYTEAIPNRAPFRLDGYYETTPNLKSWLESRLKGKVSKCYQNL